MASDLFYNRDSNISGVTIETDYLSLGLTPVYGSKVSFSSREYSYETDDFYLNRIPNSMNSLEADFEVKYDLNQANTQKLAAFIEDNNGNRMFEFNIDNSGIYKNMSGICDNYAINHISNQHYEVAVKITVDQAPNLFNWSGMNFLNYGFQEWNDQDYEKYDIVYSGVNDNKLDNFYYCIEDHEALNDEVDGPTGSSSKWSQDFFFEPDIGFQNDVQLKNYITSFKNSFHNRIKDRDNNASFPVSYKFTSITDKQLKAMLHFLENKGGYRNFRHDIPSIYNRPKAMYCPQWSHTWKYKNSHDLEVTLIEDVLGVIKEN